MEELLKKNYEKNIEEAKTLTERWVEGDKVRVLKNLDINISAVKDYLGKICVVEKTVKHIPIFNSPKIEYQLRLGDRLEPFWEDELDARFKSNCN